MIFNTYFKTQQISYPLATLLHVASNTLSVADNLLYELLLLLTRSAAAAAFSAACVGQRLLRKAFCDSVRFVRPTCAVRRTVGAETSATGEPTTWLRFEVPPKFCRRVNSLRINYILCSDRDFNGSNDNSNSNINSNGTKLWQGVDNIVAAFLRTQMQLLKSCVVLVCVFIGVKGRLLFGGINNFCCCFDFHLLERLCLWVHLSPESVWATRVWVFITHFRFSIFNKNTKRAKPQKYNKNSHTDLWRRFI